MKRNESDKEQSSDYETVGNIEAIDSMLENINHDPFMNNIDQKVDAKEIIPDEKFISKAHSETECNSCWDVLKTIFFRIIDTFLFILLVLSFIFLFISIISIVFEVTISFYSVIMMNYVFFISSIVSYAMAPIYQSLANDWLNFSFSFTQVILASPLIGFYIFYISKSVVSLASFVSDIPSVIQHISVIFIKGDQTQYKQLFSEFFSNFFWRDFSLIYECKEIKIILKLFFIGIGLIILAAALAYIELCFDKTIILLGSICYVINTIQIFILVLPSYLYFFQTLFNIKFK